MKAYEDRVLLKLQRKFSKDETVSLQKEKIERLSKELKESEFQRGVLKSQLDECQYDIKKLDLQLNEEIELCQELRSKMSDFDKELNKRISKYKEKFKKSNQDSHYWRDRFLSLQAQVNKNKD